MEHWPVCMHVGDGGMVCRACEKNNLILTALCLSLWYWMKVTFEQHQSWNFFLRKKKKNILFGTSVGLIHATQFRIFFKIWSLKLFYIICPWCSPSAVADKAKRRGFNLTTVNPNSQKIWGWFDLKPPPAKLNPRMALIHFLSLSLPSRSNWGDFFILC